MTKTSKLDRLQELCDEATPAPWKYDWGNWEVEGPRPDRYQICPLDASTRRPSFHGQEPNPVNAPADGELIAAARNVLPLFIALAKAVRAHQERWKNCTCVMGQDGSCEHCQKAEALLTTIVDSIEMQP